MKKLNKKKYIYDKIATDRLLILTIIRIILRLLKFIIHWFSSKKS